MPGELDVYFFALNRLFAKGEQEHVEGVAQELKGINFTTRQRYFISNLESALLHALSLSRDLENESLLLDALKAATTVVAVNGITKMVSPLIGAKAEVSDLLVGTTTGLATYYSAKSFLDKVQVKNQAKRVADFLGNEMLATAPNQRESKHVLKPPSLITTLVCELYLEFRPAIEMLAKSKEGAGILIKFLVDRILQIVHQIPADQLSKLSFTDRLDYIKRNLLTNSTVIPTTALEVRGCKPNVLDWTLQGLLTRSPIIVCTQMEQQHVYRLVSYACTDSTKKRYMRTVSADDSYKCPSIVRFTKREADLAPGYVPHAQREYVSPTFRGSPPIDHTFSEEIDAYYDRLIEYYGHLRALHLAPKNIEQFKMTMVLFSSLSSTLREIKCYTHSEYLSMFIEYEQLKNTFVKVITPVYETHHKSNTQVSKLWQECQHWVKTMSEAFVDAQRVALLVRTDRRTQEFYHSRLPHIRMRQATPQEAKKQTDLQRQLITLTLR